MSESEDSDSSTCDTWDSVDYKLNFTRSERSTRITWWVWQSVIRSWILCNAAVWVQCYVADDELAKAGYFDGHFESWPLPRKA